MSSMLDICIANILFHFVAFYFTFFLFKVILKYFQFSRKVIRIVVREFYYSFCPGPHLFIFYLICSIIYVLFSNLNIHTMLF
jgi:hypothetical protein